MRRPHWHYDRPGWYFITIVAHQRLPLFGSIQKGKLYLSAAGQIVDQCWRAIPFYYPQLALDQFIIMPDLHGLIRAGADGQTKTLEKRLFPHDDISREQPVGVSKAIRSFKSASTREINNLRDTDGLPIWQRGFYDRIVRNFSRLDRIRRYIRQNPYATIYPSPPSRTLNTSS